MHMNKHEDARRAQEASDNIAAAWFALVLSAFGLLLLVLGPPAFALLR